MKIIETIKKKAERQKIEAAMAILRSNAEAYMAEANRLKSIGNPWWPSWVSKAQEAEEHYMRLMIKLDN